MKKILKRLATGFLAFATIVTALPTTAVHASEKQYWTESAERVGIVEKVMNDGSIGSTFNEGHMTVEGEDAFCVDINTNFRNGYKTRADASTRMSYDQISDVALSIEYVNQYVQSHSGLSSQHKVAGNYVSMLRGLVKKYNKTHKDQLPNITPHSFRHTYCTNMANKGMNPNTLQYIMGHSNITMTLGYYAHGTFNSAKAELERLALAS